jgi:hypothetical protein
MHRAFVLVAALLPVLALAQPDLNEGPTLRDALQARTQGMGGAHRAIGGGTDAVDGNPAAVGLFKRYVIELSGAWDPRSSFGFGSLGVMDAVTSPLAAGLSYHLISLGTEGTERVAHVNTGAFSLPIGQVLYVGMSMRHVLMTGARSANAVTGDAGVLLNLGGLVFGVSGHNLVNIHNPEFARHFAASAGFISPVFTVVADVRGDFNGEEPKLAWSAGGEYLLGGALALRGGYAQDRFTTARRVSGGLGLNIDGGGIDFSYGHELGGRSSRMFGLALRVQVQ